MSDPSWFICPKPQADAKMRLFAFPYAGGGVPVFRNWAQGLAPHVELQVLQLPGRGSRLDEKPLTRLEDILPAIDRAAQALLDLPFACFGYSMGGLLSFEWTRRLRRDGKALPRRVFIAACQAPQRFKLRRAPGALPVHQLPEADFLDYLRGMDFGPAETLINHETLREIFLPTVRADLEVGETYQYREEDPLPCPITAFGGLRDPLVSPDEIEAWREQTRGGFRSVMLDRKHDFLESDRDFLMEEVLKDLGLAS